MTMAETTLNLLMQIPLAGIVVVVVLLFLNYLNKAEDRNRTYFKEIEERSLVFIREQREANNLATARLAEEIKSITLRVEALTVCFQKHDEHVRLSFENLKRDK
jgi:hypothetical protein